MAVIYNKTIKDRTGAEWTIQVDKSFGSGYEIQIRHDRTFVMFYKWDYNEMLETVEEQTNLIKVTDYKEYWDDRRIRE